MIFIENEGVKFFSVMQHVFLKGLRFFLLWMSSGFWGPLEASDVEEHRGKERKACHRYVNFPLSLGASYIDSKGRVLTWGGCDFIRHQALSTVHEYHRHASDSIEPDATLLGFYEAIRLKGSKKNIDFHQVFETFKELELAQCVSQAAAEIQTEKLIEGYIKKVKEQQEHDPPFGLKESPSLSKKFQDLQRSADHLQKEKGELENKIQLFQDSYPQEEKVAGEKHLPKDLKNKKESLRLQDQIHSKEWRTYEEAYFSYMRIKAYRLVNTLFFSSQQLALLWKPSFMTSEEFSSFYKEIQDLRILSHEAIKAEQAVRKLQKKVQKFLKNLEENIGVPHDLKPSLSFSPFYRKVKKDLEHQIVFRFSSLEDDLKGELHLSSLSISYYALAHTLVPKQIEAYRQDIAKNLLTLVQNQKERKDEARDEEQAETFQKFGSVQSILDEALQLALWTSDVQLVKEIYQAWKDTLAQDTDELSFSSSTISFEERAREVYAYVREQKQPREESIKLLEDVKLTELTSEELLQLLKFYLNKKDKDKITFLLASSTPHWFDLFNLSSEPFLSSLREYMSSEQRTDLEAFLWKEQFLKEGWEQYINLRSLTPQQVQNRQTYALERLHQLPRILEEQGARKLLVDRYVNLMPSFSLGLSEGENFSRKKAKAKFEEDQGFPEALRVLKEEQRQEEENQKKLKEKMERWNLEKKCWEEEMNRLQEMNKFWKKPLKKNTS